jgi:hypothetical protein
MTWQALIKELKNTEKEKRQSASAALLEVAEGLLKRDRPNIREVEEMIQEMGSLYEDKAVPETVKRELDDLLLRIADLED